MKVKIDKVMTPNVKIPLAKKNHGGLKVKTFLGFYIGIFVFLVKFGVWKYLCAPLDVTKVLAGIFPVQQDNIGAFSALKLEI